MLQASWHYLCTHKILVGFTLLIIITTIYLLFFGTLTFSPATEATRMERLERTKQTYELQPFMSDGCSGNVSSNWRTVVSELSQISDSFANNYRYVGDVPFEKACVEHDLTYYTGKGGYVGRLQADNKLRSDIIDYGTNNSSTIQSRTGLKSTEEAVFLYEVIAEAVYRGVRVGGAPCTGKSYAWGYGYYNGSCVE